MNLIIISQSKYRARDVFHNNIIYYFLGTCKLTYITNDALCFWIFVISIKTFVPYKKMYVGTTLQIPIPML